MRKTDHRESEVSCKLALGDRGVCHEEEKVFGRADRGGAEAGRSRDGVRRNAGTWRKRASVL